MSAQNEEITRIDPPGQPITLSTGMQVNLQRLQTRQLFRLLKILTHGGMASGVLSSLDFSLAEGDFMQRLVTLLLLSIPDADQEALEFIATMVEPAGIVKRPKLSQEEKDANQKLWAELNQALVNPDPADTIDLIVAIVEQEAPEFQALGKKLAAAVALFTKTGQDKEKPPAPVTPQELSEMSGVPASPVPPSEGLSPAPSISSLASTAGTTSESLTSPSAG